MENALYDFPWNNLYSCSSNLLFSGYRRGFLNSMRAFWFTSRTMAVHVRLRLCTLWTLRKTRWQQERHQRKGLMSKTKACTCVIIPCTFLCRPPQNNNVNWRNSALSARENDKHNSYFFVYLIGTERIRSILSGGKFLFRQSHWVDPNKCEILK